MDQVDHIHKQQTHKPIMFNVIEPSIVRSQFASNRDASFSSYVQPNGHHNNNNHHQHQRNPQSNSRAEDTDQISIFDAAKYFSSLEDEDHQHSRASPMQQHGSSKVLDLSTMGARLSSVSSVDNNSNYRARSFHATPTASSEASWNSQTGLLANPPGSLGINMIKNFSPNSSANFNSSSSTTTTTTSTTTTKWSRISKKWLIPSRKCPCSGKKSVQVEERIENKTPRMVDLRRSTSSNGTNSSSLYTTVQSSPKKSVPSIPLPIGPQQPQTNLMANRKFDHINNNNNNNKPNSPNGFSSLGSNPKAVSPLNLFPKSHANGGTSTNTATTINGFSFPILENQPVVAPVKKMFNVIAPENQADPHRDSLEVFQPRSHPSPRSRRASYEEENVSDGSSDLFEIESFSATTYPPPPRRDSMDDAAANYNATINRFGMVGCPSTDHLVIKTGPPPTRPCRTSLDYNDDDEPMTPSVAPTECYAPSEVSIDWSVTTAEAFDRGSVTNFSVSASETGYTAMRREAAAGGGGGGVGRRNGNGSGGGGGLLSCRNEKAVSVGPGPIKCAVAEAGPPAPARHVGGRAQQQQGQAAHDNRNGNSKAGVVVVGRVTF